MSLDTKYRPRSFDDVLGQDATVTILRRYIATGRSLHQSYIFAGPFGSGKTTLGRIMARAIMCGSPTEIGDPCDKCESCLSILTTGNSIDFVEVDAATNSGKADVQRVVEEIQYSTFAGRRRVYLYDEAHMLSKDALDALLKSLEDTIPGTQDKRLVCIFCTTEPEKMKATIFSRCAPTFVVQPVAPIDIAKRLALVCDKEGFEYDINMLQVIAEVSECHFRDAMKYVEGASMLGSLNVENVSKYLKLDSNLAFISILECLGTDLVGVVSKAKDVMLQFSPATCYERLATMAMLAYQVGIGVTKSPSYIESGRLKSLYELQQHRLIKFSHQFASRVGRPTGAILMCDLGLLHHGGFQSFEPHVVQTPISRVVAESPASQQFLSPVVSKAHVPSSNQRAEVRVNPKAVNGYNSGAVIRHNQVTPGINEVDPTTFCSLLAIQIAQYEGSSGSTGRSDMGRY